MALARYKRFCLLITSLGAVTLLLLTKEFSQSKVSVNRKDVPLNVTSIPTLLVSSEDKLIELLQRDRKLHLDKFCKSRKTKLNKTHLEYMIVDDKYKTIYCYVPKVACSQWNLVFLSLNNKTHVNDVHDPNHFHFLNQYSDEEINIRLKTYFKFFFVREPLERFLSAYENKFVQYKWPWDKILYFSKEMVENYRKFNNTATDDVDFTKFIFYVSGVGYDNNRHWASYERLCHPCDIEYDFIGHFEDMQQEAPFVLRKTGMDRVTSFPAFSSHNTSAKVLEKYADVPGYKIIELANRYQRDFELFNYSFPGPVAQLLKDLN